MRLLVACMAVGLLASVALGAQKERQKAPKVQKINGEITAIDKDAKTVTIVQKKEGKVAAEKKVTVETKTKIMVDGEGCDFGKLAIGQKAQAAYDEGGIARQIVVGKAKGKVNQPAKEGQPKPERAAKKVEKAEKTEKAKN